MYYQTTSQVDPADPIFSFNAIILDESGFDGHYYDAVCNFADWDDWVYFGDFVRYGRLVLVGGLGSTCNHGDRDNESLWISFLRPD